MAEKEEKLFSVFKSVSTQEWEEKISGDLKGKDYSKTLISDTYEGFSIKPYYRDEDLGGLDYLDSPAGEFPFVRGNRSKGNDWLIRQNIPVKDFEIANKKALNILSKGVNSLGFILESPFKNGGDGLEILLKDISLDNIETNFENQFYNSDYPLPLMKYLLDNYKGNKKLAGSLGIDPFASLVLYGKIREDIFGELKEITESFRELPDFRIIGVHGDIFANSGASVVQELAFSLAQGTEYLIKLTAEGLAIDEIAKNIRYTFGIGGNYFMEIAKLRAARLLWAKIVEAFGPADMESCRMIIHSKTNSINKTFYDPYVNMLRTQTEAMSAALGSADSITVEPYNAVFGGTNEFSERIARNQQILLKEEAHFDKVADPGAGSYYIENLTASLVEYAWDLFLQVNDLGGFEKAFSNGFIQEKISKTNARRQRDISSGRDSILGTTRFPDFSERKEKEVDDSYFQPQDLEVDDASVPTLKLQRNARPFELLRYKTDIFSLTDKRPVVFMLTIGDLSYRRARAQFSCNFFAVAGFDVVDNNGFASPEEGVAAAREKNADIIVVCSSDDEYSQIVPAVDGLVNNEILVVAGNPACRPQLEEIGIYNFIHIKSDMVDELEKYQSGLTDRHKGNEN